MKIITNQEQFKATKSRGLVVLECPFCQTHFQIAKNQVQTCIKGDMKKYCSKKCSDAVRMTRVETKCKECSKPLIRMPSEMQKNKNAFCSHVCAGTYTTKNKTTGGNRSKLERWIESQLISLYPERKFLFNDTTAIQAELDIFCPELNLAFELNGIFHYENIFGKLEKTQNRDKMKVTLCSELGISLCVIDTRKHSYFKEKFALEVLKIIQDIVQERIAANS
jgi:hypothetical protein